MADRPKVRVTLSMDAEVLANYQRFAKLSNQSLSAFINGWLADTEDSADYLSVQLYAERDDVRQMQRSLLQRLESVESSIGPVGKRRAAGVGAAPPPRARPAPPSCNTGGKFANGKGASRG